MNKFKIILHKLLYVAVFASVIFSALYFVWWRCGEMFPAAQLACFVGSK